MNKLESLSKQCIVEGRHVIFNEPLDLKSFTGIIFYYAEWSESINNLFILFKTIPANGGIRIYVYDLDLDYYKIYLRKNVGQASGWGDLFWFRNGILIASVQTLRTESFLPQMEKYNNEMLK